MTRSRKSQLIDFNPEPERLIRRNLQKIKDIIGRSPTRRKSKSLNMDNQLGENPPMDGVLEPNAGIEQVPPLNVNPPRNEPGVNPPVAIRTMMDYCRPNLEGANTSIARPRVMANNFEIKPSVIQMVQQCVQFDGFNDEDPNTHLQQFLEICDTFKINGASEDAIRLGLFPFSLRNNARRWLNALPSGWEPT